jgi:nucleotide-binding universal stress UspA family protein
MDMKKKILVPVDFSDHTENVCRFALEIAKKTGGELRLFHAYFDLLVASAPAFSTTLEATEVFDQEMMVKIRETAIGDIKRLQAGLISQLTEEEKQKVNIVYNLSGGLPEEEILNISETYQPDLIIMGTHGKGEKDFLTGKVSSKVVHNATCRILTVPRDAVYKSFKNVMYATGFKTEDAEALQKLINLVSGYNPTIHCVHIDLDDNTDEDRHRMNVFETNFKEKINQQKVIFEVIRNDDFIEGINQYVDTREIDLIAVVHYRKSLLKRLFVKDHTRELLFHSKIPLYIFPER